MTDAPTPATLAAKPFADPEEIGAMMKDSAEFAANLAKVAERAGEVWRRFAESNAADRRPMHADPLNAAPAFAELGQTLMEHPKELGDAMLRLWLQQAELWRRATFRLWGLD
jgi:polyhydroxyalkanoate synthase